MKKLSAALMALLLILTGCQKQQRQADIRLPEPETPAADTRLSETEQAFLHCLLEHQPYANLLRQGGVMLSVLVDHINETLFDDFGDTVILFDGDQPELIEDYVEELRALLG